MSVLITPLPNNDAIIMTASLTCYLHDILYINIEHEKAHIVLSSNLDKKFLIVKYDYDTVSFINNKLSNLDLVYHNSGGYLCFPKTSISYAYKEDGFIIYISKTTFIKIQEDIMLKHVQTIEREELERENKMMRAHIEFSPGGQEFFKVMESFKNKQ